MRLRKTAGSLLAIGMVVQILTGVLWILCNFPSEWSYPESEYYISAAGSWVIDEYTGVLYPMLIRVCQMITGWFGLPFEWLICLVQLGTAFLCYSAFILWCKKGEGSRRRVLLQAGFGGLYLLTVPLCVQWHLSILPSSLTGSLFILMIGLCIRAFGDAQYCNSKTVIRVCVLWAVLTLLNPDYWWIALTPVIAINIMILRKKGFRAFAIFLGICVGAGILSVGINRAVQTPGSSGKIQRSLGASMVSRMVWPNFDTNYFFWPDEIKEIMTPLQGTEISSHADLVQLFFGPMVESAYGRDKAEQLYWQMAVNCIQVRTKEVFQAIGEDFVAYSAAPWQVKTQLDGSGLSYSGWHYDKMKTKTPELTRWYVDYSLVSFRIGIIVAAGLFVSHRIRKGKAASTGNRWILWFPVLCGLFQSIWYTMAAGGMMDYRNVSLVILLWYSAIYLQYESASSDECTVGCAEEVDER